MHKRTKKSKVIQDLKKNIPPNRFQNMMILGLNITLNELRSNKDKDRAIIFLNNSLINSRKEFDTLVNDMVKYQKKQDLIKARIMNNIDDYKQIDPEIFKILDQSDE